MAAETKAEEQKKRKKTLVLIIIVLAAAVVGLVAYIVWYQPQAQELQEKQELQAEKNAQMGIIPGMSDDEIQQRLNEKVAEGMLNVAVNPNPVFQNGKSEGNLRIENIPGNQYAVTVTVTLDGTGEVVYESGLIDPGYFVENVTLDKNLDAGQYPALALFTAYDLKTKEKVGTAGIRINITVQS